MYTKVENYTLEGVSSHRLQLLDYLIGQPSAMPDLSAALVNWYEAPFILRLIIQPLKLERIMSVGTTILVSKKDNMETM